MTTETATHANGASFTMSMLSSKFRAEWLVYRWDSATSDRWVDTGPSADSWVPACETSIDWLFASDPSRRRRFVRFLHYGCLGLFLIRDGQWISYGWSTQPGKAGPPHLPRWVRRVGAYWIFYCHTREAFRGQGNLNRLFAELVSRIHARDPEAQIFLDTVPENVASNRAAIRSGFTSSGVIVTYNLCVPFMRRGRLVLGGNWLREQPHFPRYYPLAPSVRPYIKEDGAEPLRHRP